MSRRKLTEPSYLAAGAWSALAAPALTPYSRASPQSSASNISLREE